MAEGIVKWLDKKRGYGFVNVYRPPGVAPDKRSDLTNEVAEVGTELPRRSLQTSPRRHAHPPA